MAFLPKTSPNMRFRACALSIIWRSQRQPTALTTPSMLVYSSSIAMVVVANYLALHRRSVSLIEPCIDHIYNILHNMGIVVSPLAERWLHNAQKLYANLEAHIDTDTLIIVEPNNPTGFTLEGRTQLPQERLRTYRELFRYAKTHHKLLVFDFCFAAFSLQDAKVAIIKTSKDIYQDVYNIYTSYLLNVSPFVLHLITQYVLDSEQDNFASVLDPLKHNRQLIRDALRGSLLEMQEPYTNVGVAWFKIKNPHIKASDLQKRVQKRGVYVLPGDFFFWSNHKKGERFIRLALARDSSIVEAGAKKLRAVLDAVERELSA
jgi:aspartate/methionine/tyrosine aminotransferase